MVKKSLSGTGNAYNFSDNFERVKTVQNQIQRLKSPLNSKKDCLGKGNLSDLETFDMGIQLVRFDDDNKRTSSVKVPMTPFLVPLSQSVTIFD